MEASQRLVYKAQEPHKRLLKHPIDILPQIATESKRKRKNCLTLYNKYDIIQEWYSGNSYQTHKKRHLKPFFAV